MFMTGASGNSKCENGSAAMLVKNRLVGVTFKASFLLSDIHDRGIWNEDNWYCKSKWEKLQLAMLVRRLEGVALRYDF